MHSLHAAVRGEFRYKYHIRTWSLDCLCRSVRHPALLAFPAGREPCSCHPPRPAEHFSFTRAPLHCLCGPTHPSFLEWLLPLLHLLGACGCVRVLLALPLALFRERGFPHDNACGRGCLLRRCRRGSKDAPGWFLRAAELTAFKAIWGAEHYKPPHDRRDHPCPRVVRAWHLLAQMVGPT